MKKVRRVKVIAGAALCIIAGIVWQAGMTAKENKQYPAVGAYADVGSYQAHYYSKGEGDTAFVFITGSGTPCAYTDFYQLQNDLSQMGQTISFDHAGSGWSTDTKEERTIEHLVSELALLIDTVAPEKRIILICHSLGSLEAISYAQTYPERIAGLIALDCGSPEFYSTDSELTAKLLNRGCALLRVTGINRILGNLGGFLPLYGEDYRHKLLPDDISEIDQAMFYKFSGNSSSLATISLMNENAKKVAEHASLGSIPLLVLSSDYNREWNDTQLQLASWSENSRQKTIKGSSHYLYWSNYDEVVQEIKNFICDLVPLQ